MTTLEAASDVAVFEDSIIGTAIIYTALSAKCPSALTVIAKVPAIGERVPSTISIVASTGDVAATPVSTQRQYLFVEAVIVDKEGVAVLNSTLAFGTSIAVVMLARVTAVVPEATDAEMSEK